MKKLAIGLLLLIAVVFCYGENPSQPASGPIDQLVAKLSKTHGLWENGTFPIINLPETASTEEILAQVFKTWGFNQGHVKAYKIVQVKEVAIDHPANKYTAVLVETDLGRKTALIRYGGEKAGWWSHVYDADGKDF